MGTCFSSTKVSGSNSNSTANAVNAAVNHNRKETAKPQTRTTAVKSHATSHHHHQRPKVPDEIRNAPANKNSQQQHLKPKEKHNSKRQPCGKRTDFGYEKDFDSRYSLGKLLGHGQFGYTYVGVDLANGDRVAVKRIDKSKVLILRIHELLDFSLCLFYYL